MLLNARLSSTYSIGPIGTQSIGVRSTSLYIIWLITRVKVALRMHFIEFSASNNVIELLLQNEIYEKQIGAG